MEERIKHKLISELAYSDVSAQRTARDLCAIRYPDLREGVVRWLTCGLETSAGEGEYSTETLMKTFRMTYPAALIFIDWYRTDPSTAVSALRVQM